MERFLTRKCKSYEMQSEEEKSSSAFRWQPFVSKSPAKNAFLMVLGRNSGLSPSPLGLIYFFFFDLGFWQHLHHMICLGLPGENAFWPVLIPGSRASWFLAL